MEAENQEARRQWRQFLWFAPFTGFAVLFVILFFPLYLLLLPYHHLSSFLFLDSILMVGHLVGASRRIRRDEFGQVKHTIFSYTECGARIDKEENLSRDWIWVWKVFSHLYWLYVEGKWRRNQAMRPTPEILSDDRLPHLQALFRNVEIWNEAVILLNRLISAVETGLIQETDISLLLEKFRAGEDRLRKQIEYGRLLLSEGSLGSSHGSFTNAHELAEFVDVSLEKLFEVEEDLRELTGRINAQLSLPSVT